MLSLVESLDDILKTFNVLPGLAAEKGPSEAPVKPEIFALNGLERDIYDFLQAGESGIDELQSHCGCPVNTLLNTLMMLELKRVIKQLPGKRFTLLEAVHGPL